MIRWMATRRLNFGENDLGNTPEASYRNLVDIIWTIYQVAFFFTPPLNHYCTTVLRYLLGVKTHHYASLLFLLQHTCPPDLPCNSGEETVEQATTNSRNYSAQQTRLFQKSHYLLPGCESKTVTPLLEISQGQR